MKLNKFIFSFLFVFMFFATSQTQIKDTNEAKNSLQKGKFALMFGVVDLNLIAVDGAFISIKYHITDHISLRAGLFGKYSCKEYDHKTLTSTAKNKENKQEFLTIVYFTYYPKPKADINAYFGLGPYYLWKRDYEKSTYSDPKYNSESCSREWGLGVNGIIGVEWFVTKSISLFGDYSFSIGTGKTEGYSYGYDDYYGNGYYYDTFNGTTNAFNSNGVRLGIGVYFDFPF